MKTVLATLTLALATPAHGAKDWPSRAKAVKGALKDAFRAYEKDASGFDDLAPVSRRGVNWLYARATLVDALDSLYVVGLREDYERAVNEVLRPTLVGEPPFWQSVSVFEYHIRVIGGLLGAFEVSGDRRLLHAASRAADRVLSVLPRRLGDAYTRTRQRLADPYGRPILWLVARIIDEVQARWPGQNKNCASLAGVGSFGLELRVLSRETGDRAYAAAADRIFDQLHEGWRADGGGDMKRWTRGFYGKDCNFNNRLQARRGLGSGGDSFHEYLLKEQLVGDASEDRAAMYDWVEGRMMREALPNEHLALFAPGMLALGATAPKRRRSASSTSRQRALARARELVDGHGRDWYRTATGLGADGKGEENRWYALRPEYVESLFYLYRTTGDEVYRDRGWAVFEALVTHCRVKATGAFAGLKDVRSPNPELDDAMPSFFLAETLKYLYLLFSERDVYPLDDWVFTTEAHLLSVEPRCDRAACVGPERPPRWRRLPLDVVVLLLFGCLLWIRVRRRRRKERTV